MSMCVHKNKPTPMHAWTKACAMNAQYHKAPSVHVFAEATTASLRTLWVQVMCLETWQQNESCPRLGASAPGSHFAQIPRGAGCASQT